MRSNGTTNSPLEYVPEFWPKNRFQARNQSTLAILPQIPLLSTKRSNFSYKLIMWRLDGIFLYTPPKIFISPWVSKIIEDAEVNNWTDLPPNHPIYYIIVSISVCRNLWYLPAILTTYWYLWYSKVFPLKTHNNFDFLFQSSI